MCVYYIYSYIIVRVHICVISASYVSSNHINYSVILEYKPYYNIYVCIYIYY